MRRIVWLENAKNDLKDIVLYYNERNGSTVYSRKLVNVLKSSLLLLETNPFLGIKVKNKENYRVLIIKNYKVFYKILLNRIEIMLVWDTRQNPDKIPVS